MGLTKFPHGVSSFGIPQTGGRLGFKNAAKVLFVDGLSGSDGNTGESPDSALLTIGRATVLADAYDVIYVLDKGLSGTDPNPYQEVTANLSVAYDKFNLAIIGVPTNGIRPFGLQVKNMTGATTSVLTVKAPFCTIENLDFNKGGTGVGPCIDLLDDGNTTNQAQGTSIYNCHLRNADLGSAARTTAGGIRLSGGWYYTIMECEFFDCRNGISLLPGTSTIKGTQIRNCIFNGLVANIDTDICVTGVVYNTLIDNCTFSHDVPAFAGAGFLTAYIYDLVSAPGSVSRCAFGTDDASCNATVTSEIVIATTVRIAACYDEAGLVARA